ncbi:MAG: tetratricopeptide repeat protein [candidate division WOR-3 bacterium]|nr:MAG: tetratricopeptide repeat protein [candidate division WOR-3 bacterium]
MPELGEVKRQIAELEAKGDIDRAISELQKATKDFPREGSLYNKLGDLYIKVNRPTDALAVYEVGARSFKEETYYPNAIALCKKILRLDKSRTEIYGLLGELHKELDQRGEAANYLLEYAERKMKENDLESALETYNIIKELVPNNPKIIQTISAIYEQVGKKDRGAELRKEAREIESKQEKLKEKIATQELAEKTAEEKEPLVEEVKEEAFPAEEKREVPLEEFVSPEVAELLADKPAAPVEEETEVVELSDMDKSVELGELYLNLGSEDEAIDCFRGAAEKAWSSKNFDSVLTLNKKIAELRPFDLESRQQLIKIAEMNGDTELQINSMLEMAEAYNRTDKRGEAHLLYKKVLEIDPNNAIALEMVAAVEEAPDFIDLGEVLRTELKGDRKAIGPQNIETLISEFRREVFGSIGEGDYHSHYDLGVAYKGMGLYQEAIEEFEIASKDEDLRLKAYEMIGSCFLERNKIDGALRILNEGLKIGNRPSREYFGIHFLIGKCYESQENLTQALRSYMDAYNIDKTVPDLIKKINFLKNKITEIKKRGGKIQPPKGEKPEPPPKREKVTTKKSKITYL